VNDKSQPNTSNSTIEKEPDQKEEEECTNWRCKPENKNRIIPNAIFHGLGDNCKDNKKGLAHSLEVYTGQYSACIQIGSGTISSIIMNFEKQAEIACEEINSDINFQSEFNVIGLSQGALLARYII